MEEACAIASLRRARPGSPDELERAARKRCRSTGCSSEMSCTPSGGRSMASSGIIATPAPTLTSARRTAKSVASAVTRGANPQHHRLGRPCRSSWSPAGGRASPRATDQHPTGHPLVHRNAAPDQQTPKSQPRRFETTGSVLRVRFLAARARLRRCRPAERLHRAHPAPAPSRQEDPSGRWSDTLSRG